MTRVSYRIRSSIADYIIMPPPLKPSVFVDHQKSGRSGHLGHAMLQRRNGELMVFYPNCSADDPGRHGVTGHSAVGWMEVMRSTDFGTTWSGPEPLRYSKQAIENHTGTAIFTEKAVVTDNDVIVLFHLVSDISEDALWEPYLVPTTTRSLDGGRTWSLPREVGRERGRIYDALYLEGVIYALKFCNDATVDFRGTTDDHVYELLTSKDEGAAFEKLSVIPFKTRSRGYGTMCQLKDGRIIVYIYDREDEKRMLYSISSDTGKTWSEPKTSYFAKQIRNPQMIAFADGYFLHGRSGSYGTDEERGHFVIYYSTDGLNWDDGLYLAKRERGQGAYSNSLVVMPPMGTEQSPRLRIHASHAYEKDLTNILAWWIWPKV